MLARVVRDYIDESIDEVIIDDKKFYDDFLSAKEHFIPHSKIKIENYDKSVPIFSNFGIETQVQSVYRRKVTLPSGGNIVFDTTEASVVSKTIFPPDGNVTFLRYTLCTCVSIPKLLKIGTDLS